MRFNRAVKNLLKACLLAVAFIGAPVAMTSCAGIGVCGCQCTCPNIQDPTHPLTMCGDPVPADGTCAQTCTGKSSPGGPCHNP
jgi:hypothetical protein